MAKKDKALGQASEHLDGETVLASALGAYETKSMGNDTVRNGVLIATDRRLVFYAKKVGGYQLESFPYGNISSFEQGKNMMGGNLSFFASGNKVSVKWISDAKDLSELVAVVRNHTSHATQTVVAAPPSPPPAATIDPMEQLTKLNQLRDAGLLTEDEFQAKRRAIVDQL